MAGTPGDDASRKPTLTIRPSGLPMRWQRPFWAWQQEVTDRPFFAFLNFYDAHVPYRAPEAFIQQFCRDRPSNLDRYDAAIAWLDHVVGTILDSLKQRGVLDRTIVIVTSDHGEQFGEHGLPVHGNSLYLPC